MIKMTDEQLDALLIMLDAISTSNNITLESYDIINKCTDRVISFNIQKINNTTCTVGETYELVRIRGPFQQIKHSKTLPVTDIMREVENEYNKIKTQCMDEK